jgi:hypothetical protein
MSISAPTGRFRASEGAYRSTIVGAADGVSRQLRATEAAVLPEMS